MGSVSRDRPEPVSPPSKSAASKDVTAGNGRWKLPALPVLQSWEISVLALTLLPMAGFIVLNPYQTTRRAEMDCGAVCLGSMTSAYSALGLIGAPLVGALSDSFGRRFALALGTVASILSLAVMGGTYSLAGLWLSLVPGALLAHNFTVTKAVVADLSAHEDRAGMMGKLGLAAGLGFMAGPLFTPIIKNFHHALLFALVMQLLSLLAVRALPVKEETAAEQAAKAAEGRSPVWSALALVWVAIKEVVVLAVSAPAAARVLLLLRFGLSAGFHVFQTVMSVLLKDRYNFGPDDYTNYFFLIGFMYAGSQLFARAVINRFDSNPTPLLAVCILIIGMGRYAAASTDSITLVYCSMAVTVAALGLLNTSISTIVTRISTGDTVGGLMGVLDTS
ncbi:major facilitator superfamily domain-containing protein, partial [Baffinella frigidus]